MKPLLLTLTFLLACMLSFAQRSIHGKVVDESGLPVIGATILVQGTQLGTTSNNNGEFSLSIPESATHLQVRSVGYEAVTIPVTAETSYTITLHATTQSLNQVVVTALGIRRDVRSLGYASQEVNAQELTVSHQPNLVNALQGRVAGVMIGSTGGGPGQGASILIRGVNSLDPGKNNQPLFVVDGIPVDNTTSTLGTTGGRGVQMTNRIADINPDDIESITVLRGGAATALYGLRGANGVIVITTKSAKAGQFRVSYDMNYSYDVIDKTPKVQSLYTQGYNGVYDSTSFWPNWGPTVADARKIDPTHPAKLFDHYKHAYTSGNQIRHTLSLSGGTDKASVSSSVSYFHQNGVLPFTYYQDISTRLSGKLVLSKKVETGTTILYANTGGNFYDADRFNEEMTYWAPRWDVRDYLTPEGTEKTYGNGNAWYKAATNKFKSYVNHVIASSYFSYQPFNWMNLTYRFGVDAYQDNRTATAPGPKGIPGEYVDDDNGQGFVHKYGINYRQLNSNLLLTLQHNWGRFGTSLRLGHDLLDRAVDEVATEGDELDIYNLFTLSNAKIIHASEYRSQYHIIGAYGELELSYDQALYLTLTGRNDWTSTLEKGNRSFFYPSANLSYIFSETMHQLPSWLSYGKIRASLAQIGKDADPYSTSIVYIPTGTPVNGVNLWTRSNAAGLQSLKPEKTTSFEIGTDLSFLNNRITLNFTWYHSISQDQIIPVATAPSTGFTSITLNAGKIRNQGIELTLQATPITSKSFSWETDINVSHNENKILSIYPGLQRIEVGSQFGYAGATVTMYYVPGGSAGDIYGSHWLRYYPDGKQPPTHVDKKAPLVIDSNGFPVRASDQQILGNSYPKWLVSWNHTLTYGNWTLSFLFDAHLNVQKYDQLNNFMAAFGIAAYTLNRNETIIFPGVHADGTPNTTPVWLGQGTGPDGKNYGAGYYRNYYRGVSENFVEDASWIRLRTLSLSYQLPARWLKGTFIKGLNIGFTGNNLWLHTHYIGFDPESSSAPAGSNANGFAGFTYPALRNFMVHLHASF
ncbi:SusC/RagA family TonB-linked outer membrane protein [Thermoflavifilum thermophilum]|uniref:TonB-linked outer membrane protein, SusC/RagA family n=1 Tax=Thermoflavifilum thermophilum TaxID=1393122 RepID=A0A1I7N260_9BACT|nr:SusC/RagA family TonB-linked outer membrane protein [Thermoflavifilum thermophilum]SFV28705.1 TonB-linked outer membrane protein, SusC/RagA family [Thermoflavifilum thermophilum]